MLPLLAGIPRAPKYTPKQVGIYPNGQSLEWKSNHLGDNLGLISAGRCQEDLATAGGSQGQGSGVTAPHSNLPCHIASALYTPEGSGTRGKVGAA